MNGRLELIIGNMFSGKSTELIRRINREKSIQKKILVINYSGDNRYANNAVATHDQTKVNCLILTNLSDFNKGLINSYDSFFIDEGQFFQDIVEWVRIAVDVYKKKVYICGLDGDFERKSFVGNWLDLIRYCDKIYKLHSFCNKCKRKQAIFSHRLTYDTAQKVIGADNYVPLCRNCFLYENP